MRMKQYLWEHVRTLSEMERRRRCIRGATAQPSTPPSEGFCVENQWLCTLYSERAYAVLIQHVAQMDAADDRDIVVFFKYDTGVQEGFSQAVGRRQSSLNGLYGSSCG